MLSKLRCSFSYGLLLAVLLTSTLASAQTTARSPKKPGPARQEQEDRDNPIARQAWFLRGRMVPGQSAAALLHRAFRQKITLRKIQQQRALEQAAPSGGPGGLAGGPLPMGTGIGPAWTNLGPAPITGMQARYGDASGRIQAVTVDPNDTTGNTVYIGSAYGGVWKTTNGTTATPSNVAWTSLFDTDPAAATLSVGAVTVLPCGGPCGANGPIILVGTGEPNNAIDSYYGQGILRFDPVGNAWSLISSANSGANSFRGMGFSKIAFSSDNTSLVVTGGAVTGFMANLGLPGQTGAHSGIYTSTDAGQTWSQATAKDGANTVTFNNFERVNDVVYNHGGSTAGTVQKFYAVVRAHGFYSSSDGINWTRIADPPGSGINTTACPASTNFSCPLYRGHLAVQPTTGDLYTVFIANSTDTTAKIYRATWNAGQVSGWTQLANTGIQTCGDGSITNGCGLSQGFYNLYIAAVPNASSTDLYVGAVNLFKCTVTAANPTCTNAGSWLNLTHVYGSCSGSYHSMHPDNHGFASVPGTNILYFGNDGGVYRSLNGPGLNTGSCAGSGNTFDDLNTSTLGSLSQFIAISTDPADGSVTLGGTQDNGSPAIAAGQTSPPLNPPLWFEAWIGDGGFNAIDHTGNNWYVTNTDVSIQKCSNGVACIESFPFSDTVTNSQVGGDSGAFYTPYMLDPANDSNVIVGTCRVWRGVANVPPTNLTALSNNFDTGTNTACTGSENNMIASLAAGGPTDVNGLSKVIYAGTDAGNVFVSTNASGGVGTFASHSLSALFRVAGLAVDATDATGQTAYATVMGFTGGAGHVWKTTNAGGAWTDITGNLPDAPVNAVLVDPGNHNIVYVGTDVGVFMTSDTTQGALTNWQEWGQSFPNVAVISLAAAPGGKLRAGTHGRGVFETQLSSSFGGYTLAVSDTPQTVYVPNLPATFHGTATSQGSFNSQVNLSCVSGTTPPPATCTPAPTPITPTGGGAALTVTASDVVSDYLFKLHGVGQDPGNTVAEASITLHVVDFTLSGTPTSVSVVPTASAKVTLTVTAQGSFTDTVQVACRLPLPTGVACSYSQNSFVPSNAGTAVTLTISTTGSTPLGSSIIHVDATGSSPGAPTRTQDITLNVVALPPALGFVPVTPCRLVDTRNATGPYGGPALVGGTSRDFPLSSQTNPTNPCGIPATAQAYSLNLTVVPPGPLGFLTAYPCGQTRPLASNLNSDGRVKAVAAIVPGGTNGDVCIYASSATNLVIDINGYFVSTSDPSPPLAFYPVTPCRMVDTRNPNGPLGGPTLVGGATRTFPLLSSSCGIPATAQAYSLNYTVVPRQAVLSFLTTWPTGQTQPLVSTLNATTGVVTANAAIVPAGTSGDVDVFVTQNTDLVIDVNGYFAPAGAGGLSLYVLTPCRVLDTRTGGAAPFSGQLDVNVVAAGCGAPTSAQAFVLNATAVPPVVLSFLTLWPQGAPRPTVSTTNSVDGSVVSNLAIVPTTNGSISAYSGTLTHLVLDISAFFAP